MVPLAAGAAPVSEAYRGIMGEGRSHEIVVLRVASRGEKLLEGTWTVQTGAFVSIRPEILEANFDENIIYASFLDASEDCGLALSSVYTRCVF